MARARKAAPSLAQAEIEGTESPGRIPELHVLGLELKDLQDRSMEARRKDADKRREIAALMDSLDMTEYDCDGVSVWVEGGKPKVKVSVKAPEEEF